MKPHPVRSASLIFTLTLLLFLPPLLYAAEVTEQDLRDAITGKRTFTQEELNVMDAKGNGDGQVDVADLVVLQRDSPFPKVSFTISEQTAYEGSGNVNIQLTISEPYTGTIRYTMGGTAEPDRVLYDPEISYLDDYPAEAPDYQAPAGEIQLDNAAVATITLSTLSDTAYEGVETIVLTLAPGVDYSIGSFYRHVVQLQDDLTGVTADYKVLLSREMPGLEGDVTAKTGMPPALSSLTADLQITETSGDTFTALIQGDNSLGFPNIPIPATSVRYTSGLGTLRMEFRYEMKSPSFVSDPPITQGLDVNFTTPENFLDSMDSLKITEKTVEHILFLEFSSFVFPLAGDGKTAFTGTFTMQIEGSMGTGITHKIDGSLLASLLTR